MTPSGVPEAQPTLITGGAGFIGSHLTERLLGQGERVVVIDDFSTGSRDNLASVADDSNLTVIEDTVTGCKPLGSLVADSSYVFHLAAAVGVDLVVQSPIRTIETNLKATEAILEAAAPSRTPMLLPSSSEVYGKSSREGFAETDDLLIGPPTLGRWSYACSKLMDEFLALAFHAERQLPGIVARIFNTVGPRQTGRYGMVLPRFVEAAKAGAPLRVFGDGQQSRCFCHVNDTVEALLRLAKCDILTLGQYLQPSLCHLPVAEYVTPGQFDEYGAKAQEMGFLHVASGPMVRSSYHADEFELPPKA